AIILPFEKNTKKTVEQTKKEGVLSSVLYRGYLSRILRYPPRQKVFWKGAASLRISCEKWMW
ncbi:hypothetical protein, partial [Bacteroides heparinolyticus]|uniref:hypothetical protein n=1 Tax=Prevotella heparinolytica TaxID=28113 RepID=UPI0035A11280